MAPRYETGPTIAAAWQTRPADDIEFLTGGTPPEGLGPGEEIGGAPRTRPPAALDRLRLAAPGLYLGAAALAVGASFQKVLRVRESTPDGGTLVYSTDGWGRLDVATAGGVHDTRYGVALCACAGGFAVIALADAVTAVAPALERRVRTLAAAGLAVTCTLAGIVAALALSVEAYFDNLRTSVRSSAAGRAELSLRFGWCLWLGIAAVVAGGLAAGVTALPRPSQAHPAGLAPRPGKLT